MCAVNLTVLGKDYSLYTHIHHSYGLNDAFDRSVAYLLTAQQSEQLSSTAESALHKSVQQKPLDQDATAVVTEDPVQGEGRRLDQDESLNVQPAATAEVAEGPRRDQDESTPLAPAAAAATERRRRLAVISQDKRSSWQGMKRHLSQHSESQQNHHQTLCKATGNQADSQSHTSSLQPSLAGARRRSMLQEVVKGVEHPCLHEGYFQNYAWVAHGAHVGPLPRVHLVGR